MSWEQKFSTFILPIKSNNKLQQNGEIVWLKFYIQLIIDCWKNEKFLHDII